jgi:hypothetical protein
VQSCIVKIDNTSNENMECINECNGTLFWREALLANRAPFKQRAGMTSKAMRSTTTEHVPVRIGDVPRLRLLSEKRLSHWCNSPVSCRVPTGGNVPPGGREISF